MPPYRTIILNLGMFREKFLCWIYNFEVGAFFGPYYGVPGGAKK